MSPVALLPLSSLPWASLQMLVHPGLRRHHLRELLWSLAATAAGPSANPALMLTSLRQALACGAC